NVADREGTPAVCGVARTRNAGGATAVPASTVAKFKLPVAVPLAGTLIVTGAAVTPNGGLSKLTSTAPVKPFRLSSSIGTLTALPHTVLRLVFGRFRSMRGPVGGGGGGGVATPCRRKVRSCPVESNSWLEAMSARTRRRRS